MLLCVDIGNTKTCSGVFDGEDIVARYDIDTVPEARLELLDALWSHLDDQGIGIEDIDGACLASVVPRATHSWATLLAGIAGEPAVVCNAAAAEGLFTADYPHPEEIGADRVADAIAARALYGAPCVVVDFGTATNIEVIDRRGCFIGGIIAPGLETSMDALFRNASKLNPVAIRTPELVIGTNTETAIRSGIVYGEADRADGLVHRIADALGYPAKVIATGGQSRFVSQFMDSVDVVDFDLTLQGLRLLHGHVCR